MKNRLKWLDIFKGICIIFVVLGHASAPFIIFIYLFHMAAFFWASGYTYNFQHNDSYLKVFIKKIITILLPYFLINILFILLNVILQHAGMENIFLNDWECKGGRYNLKLLFNKYLGTPELGGPSWFLIVLFETEAIHLMVHKICNTIKFRILKPELITLFIGIIGYFICLKHPFLPYNLDLGLLACLFYAMGIIFNKYNIFSKIPYNSFCIFCALLLIFFSCLFFNELPVNWPTRDFPPFAIFMIISISGIFFLYYISTISDRYHLVDKILQYVGQNTFAIFMYHFICFRILSLFLTLANLYPITSLKNSPPSMIHPYYWAIYSAFAISLSLLISYYGKKNQLLNYVINGKIIKRRKTNENK